MKVENEVTLPTTELVTVMLLEPYAGKLARTVLRGESSRKGVDLLDSIFHGDVCLKKKFHPGTLFYGKRGGNCCCKGKSFSLNIQIYRRNI